MKNRVGEGGGGLLWKLKRKPQRVSRFEWKRKGKRGVLSGEGLLLRCE